MNKQQELLPLKASLIKRLAEQSQQLIVELQKDAKYLAQILITPIPDPFKFSSDYKLKLIKLSRNIRCLQKIDQLISESLRQKNQNFEHLGEAYLELQQNRSLLKNQLTMLEELRNTALSINSL